jgi:arylsulfatase A-like enzyme
MELRVPARLALVLALALASLGCAREPARKPDVIVIVVDTLRADRLGLSGYARPTSPVLDQLARDGAAFTDCTAQSAWTRPSMVSLLHGRYFTAYRDAPDPQLPTLVEMFRGAGYRTLGVSANLLLKTQFGFDRGFELYDDRRANREPDATMSIPRTFEQVCADLWPLLDTPESTSAGRRPLFLYLQPFDPHAPYFEHAEYDAELPTRGVDPLFDPAWHAAELERLGSAGTAEDPKNERALRFLAYQRGLYDQEVRYADAWLGKLLDGLRVRGLLDRAIVAVVSDHGEGLWDHVAWIEPAKQAGLPPQQLFYQQHGAHLHQEALRTPFVLWGAGVPKGLRVDAAVENVDLFPTLLELADVALPEGLHGHSVVPHVRRESGSRQEPVAPREFVYSSVLLGDCVREIASGLVYIEPSELGKKYRSGPELYDLRSDPRERVNVAGERPADVERLAAALRAWRAKYPTESRLGEKSEAEIQLMNSLGYTGEHYGGK